MTPVSLTEHSIRPFFWSNERYLALVEAGIVPAGPGIELIGGQVVETMPQGELHWFIYYALQRVFASLGAFTAGLTVQPTVILGQGNVFDPEFAFVREETMSKFGLPNGGEILHVIEVSVSSRSQDLGVKKTAYAASSIPHYWVVDGIERGVWVFGRPVDGEYQQEAFFDESAELTVPVLDKAFNLASIFPAHQTGT